MCASWLQSFVPPTCFQQIHRVSGFLVCFCLVFGAVQIYVSFCAEYALKNLLTRSAIRLAEMMCRDNRNQKVVGSLHRFVFFLFDFLKNTFPYTLA